MLKTMQSKIFLLWVFNFISIGFFLFGAEATHSIEIREIHAAIQEKGANWIARETPLSRLSPEEMRRWTGALEPVRPYPGAAEKDYSRPMALPSSFDWTGSGEVTPVRNQGGCGSCWAFAATAALESKALMAFHTPGTDLDLSEQIVLSCAGSTNNCSGGYVEDAADFLKNTGTGPESCYPYTAADGNCSQACSNWQVDPYKIESWSYVVTWGNTPNLNEIKNAIYTGGPIAAWMKVYQDFQSYGGGVYSYSSGSHTGDHFITIVGWDDGKGAFHIKNSWGTSWGESGFGWIAYNQVYKNGRSPVDFCRGAIAFGNAIKVESPPTALPLDGFLESPQNGKTVSGIRTIHGWAIDGKGITKAELFIDGQWAGNIPYGGTRMDVKTAHPDYPDAENSGFGVIFNYSILSAGDHLIRVRVQNQEGGFKDLEASVTVKKFHGEFVEQVSPEKRWLFNNSVTVGTDTRNYDIEIEWLNEMQGYGISEIIPK